MSESAVNRAARALDLIPYILENPGIELDSLAEKFGITQKQVLSDLEIIFLCGLPGYTPYELIDLTFEDGIVTVIDPQVLDKPRVFTQSEAIVLNLGLSIMKAALRDKMTLERIETLQSKLQSKFKSISDVSIAMGNPPNFYEMIIQSIRGKSIVEIVYHSVSKDAISKKILAPKNVYVSAGNYYMSAIDLQLSQERNYRLDAITECVDSSGVYELADLIDDSSEEFNFKIVTGSLFLIEKYSTLFKSVEKIKGEYVASGRISNSEWLQRLVISNAPDLRLVEPANLAALIKERVESAIKLY
jgi:predicted DNA-binding transcriptional regulator YafY